jgi:hypothetical protein
MLKESKQAMNNLSLWIGRYGDDCFMTLTSVLGSCLLTPLPFSLARRAPLPQHELRPETGLPHHMLDPKWEVSS